MHKIKTATFLLSLGFQLGNGLSEKIRLALFLLMSRLSPNSKLVSKKFRIRSNVGVVDVHVRNVFSDSFILHEVFRHNEYEHGLTEKEMETIFDVGANIGLVTVYLSAKYPLAKIHCFEPDPDNFAQLIENTKELSQVVCHQVAIGEKSGTIAFYKDKTFHMRNSVLETVGGTKIEVKSVTLTDALLIAQVETIDLFKVDVEGGELGIFTTEAPYQSIQNIIGELHPYKMKDNEYKSMLSRLEAHFTLTITTEGKKVFMYGKRR